MVPPVLAGPVVSGCWCCWKNCWSGWGWGCSGIHKFTIWVFHQSQFLQGFPHFCNFSIKSSNFQQKLCNFTHISQYTTTILPTTPTTTSTTTTTTTTTDNG